MEEADDYVGMRVAPDTLHPQACRRHHVVEPQSAPQVARKPVGDGGCNEAEDGNAHTLALDDGVGFQVGLSCLGVCHVGTQHGASAFGYPLVIDAVPRLHIVVAQGLGIVPHIVGDLGSYVGGVAVYVVVIVTYGLALQDVAIVQEQQPVSILLAQPSDITAHAGHASGFGLTVDKIVRKKTAMHVAGLYYSQLDGLALAHNRYTIS